MQPDQFADLVVTAIKVAQAPLLARIAAIEGKQAQPGRDGRDGAPGLPGVGVKGDPGERGDRGPDGPAGVGTPGVKGDPGLHGKDGTNGVDGLGFDDFEETIEDGGRTVVHTYRAGDQVKTFTHKTATEIYRGVWVEKSYERGDGVTWGGSEWHCNEPTTSKPGESKAWTLKVKQGREGKPGLNGKDGVHGRDLTKEGAR